MAWSIPLEDDQENRERLEEPESRAATHRRHAGVQQTPGVNNTRRAVIAFGLVGILVAVATALIGFVLADTYRPPGTVVAELPGQARRSDPWSDGHRVGSVMLVVVAVGNLALVAAAVNRASSVVSRKGLLISAAISAIVMSVVTVITRPLVEWDQLALWAVTVGADIDGYWIAALGDDVRFVLIGNTEVTQREYAIALVTHLAAPVVSAVAFSLTAVAGRAREEIADEAVSTT